MQCLYTSTTAGAESGQESCGGGGCTAAGAGLGLQHVPHQPRPSVVGVLAAGLYQLAAYTSVV